MNGLSVKSVVGLSVNSVEEPIACCCRGECRKGKVSDRVHNRGEQVLAVRSEGRLGEHWP